jgi:hypothetical protein
VRPVGGGRRAWTLVAAALTLILAGLILGLTLSSGGSKPSPAPPVEPLPRSPDPATQARELAAWLRRYSR